MSKIKADQIQDDVINRLNNENKTLEVLITSSRVITADDVEATSGADIGKRKFLTPNSTGSVETLTMNDTPAIGDVLTFSGNVQNETAILQVFQDTTDIINLSGTNNGFTVAGSQLAMLRKLASNIYRIDGNFTEVVVDLVAPVLQSATVENGAPSNLVLQYDEDLNTGSVPATGDFSVNDGAANAVTAVDVTGTLVTLTLTNPIDNGDTVTVDYTAGVNPIQDISGNNSVNLSGQAVTNNVASGSNIYQANDAAGPVESNSANAAYWFSTGGSSIVSSATNPRTGTYAIRISKDNTNVQEPDLRVPVSQNTTYDFSIWAAYDDGGSTDTAEIRVRTANGAVSDATIGLTDTGTTYQEYTFSVTMDTGITSFDLGFKLNGTNTVAVIDVDDIVITPQ